MNRNWVRESNKPTVVSLFSGAGGMDLGFVRAGFEIIWANDNFGDAAETYKKNIGAEITCDDIRKVDLRTIPDADVVIGGFPCQGFSVANTKRNAKDERNELYMHFVKVLKTKKPKVFVAENVKGLLSLDHGRVIDRIVDDFSKAGYKVEYRLLNAADYGVPQSRERVIILGIRRDIASELNFPQPTHSSSASELKRKHVTIGEVLKKIPDPDSQHRLKNHVYTKYKSKYNGYISNRRTNPDRPAPTITARGDDRGGAMIMNHPFASRRLSCRELASAQSFPLDFEFSGSMTSVYRQIGNAVPPLFAEAIAKAILTTLQPATSRHVADKKEIGGVLAIA